MPETLSAFADRAVGGYYLDFDIRREDAARYGLTVGDVQDVIQSAIGGMNVTETVEGLERYPVRSEEHTSELQSLMRISYAVFCLKKKKKKKQRQETKFITNNQSITYTISRQNHRSR